MAVFDIKEENDFNTALELLPLLTNHYYEVESKSQNIPFEINWDMLKSLFDANMMSVVVARVDGKIVGYFANLLTEDFMTSTLAAKEVGLYIDPSYRKGSLFIKLMKYAEEVLKSKGVRLQYLTFKAGHNTELPLRLGFSHNETTYQKLLEG